MAVTHRHVYANIKNKKNHRHIWNVRPISKIKKNVYFLVEFTYKLSFVSNFFLKLNLKWKKNEGHFCKFSLQYEVYSFMLRLRRNN